MIIFFKIRQPWLPLKPGKYCSASSTRLQGPGSSSGVYVEYHKAGTAKQSLKFKLDPAALYAEFAKLESDASDRVQSERPEDIPGSFKYHGFLEHAFR